MEEEAPVFRCIHCKSSYKTLQTYTKHFDSICAKRSQQNNRYQCDQCTSVFSRLHHLKTHKERFHSSGTDGQVRAYSCPICAECFIDKAQVQIHREAAHVRHTSFRLISSAHKKQAQLFRSFFPLTILTLEEGIFYAFEKILPLIESIQVYQNVFKVNVAIMVEMGKMDQTGATTRLESFPFKGEGFLVRPFSVPREMVLKALSQIDHNVGEFLHQVWIVFLFCCCEKQKKTQFVFMVSGQWMAGCCTCLH